MITIKITIIYIYIFIYLFTLVDVCVYVQETSAALASALSGCGSPEADGHDQDAGGQPPGLMVCRVCTYLQGFLFFRAEDVEFCSAFEEGWEGSYPVFLIGLARSPGPALRFHRCLGGNGLL